MSIYGRMPQYVYNEDFTLCTHYCDGDALSTGKGNLLDRLRIYPNPMVNGLTNIRGLNGKCNFSVYNLVGQLVYNSSGESENAVINLQSQPAGAYLLRIDTGAGSRMVKIIKQD
jgi:hypothetical protein